MSNPLPKQRFTVLLLSLALVTILSEAMQAKPLSLETFKGTPVDVVQIVELPINMQDTVLVKTKKGYELNCVISNNSDSRVLGLDYLLLLIDFNNTTLAMVDGAETFKLEPNASKSLISKRLLHVEVGEGYRLILIPQRVFSTESFWEVVNAKKVLEKYASGDYSVKPEVTRATNLVDSPIGGTARF